MQPTLFDWSPPCRVILFPMHRRVGRIRSTAEKMLAKPTDRAAESYRDQVTDGLLRQMAKAGIPDSTQDEQLGAFWSAVQAETIRLTYRNNRPGDNVA
ncbi:hypothetical protein EOB59_03230 [Mesorhizobium sp. M7A.F.Ca.MR.176.00.0.0]|uniref:DUF6074 family protein n=1 Tax=Mesorhizobium sp. M7A.F.Ca.MR.176.00.0.0 TaxID=2496776 RepID=UPI000FD4EC7C|nr:DUF6074 family protein [Mesorhizobium sp. M7A.F.Ca.MR.176.00.0.0]RUU93330.1 hypothetical protein EOB59_03230 [Mesorhizobium sp. M7A.F.Ca.MR.176.00.0.0]